MKPKEHSIILTTQQLASRWGMSIRTLESWRQNDKGPNYMKLGDGRRATVLYRLSDVLKFEAENLNKMGS